MKLSRITTFIIVFALMFNMFAAAAFAKTSRTALITSVSGDVSVTKGGGSNPIPAFPNMPLNQGDTITTGEDASVTVKIADPESERTIGANSEVTISDLTADAGGKKSGFKVWVGSMWNKVKSLASGDEDAVDTPTATMGVRGTRYLVIANPDGTLSVVVASGLVDAKFTGGQQGGGESNPSKDTTSDGSSSNDGSPAQKNVLLAPTQQIDLNPAAPPTSLQTAVNIVDVSKVVQQADPTIIKAFIIDAPSIAEENKALIDQLRTSLQNGNSPVLQRGNAVSDLTFKNLDDLNKVAGNANGLVGNLVAAAVKLNKVQSSELTDLINQANSQIADPNAKIDPNAKPIDRTAGVDPVQAKKKQDEQDRINQLLSQQDLERQRQQDQLTQRLAALLAQIAEQQKKIDDQNKNVKNQLNTQAETNFVSGLTDSEKQDFNKSKGDLGNPTTPTPPPAPPVVNPPTSNEHDSSSDPAPTPVATPKVTINQTPKPNGFQLDVNLSNFTGANKIYGAELHFVSDDFRASPIDTPYGEPERNMEKFPEADSEDMIKSAYGKVGTTDKIETIYAITRFGETANAVEFGSTSTKLVSIPFVVTKPGEYHVDLAYILFVDKNGEPVGTARDVDGNGISFIFIR